MKLHKRLFTGIVAFVAVCICFFALMPQEVEAASSGTCGTNLRWTLDSEGTLTISGTGAMKDYSYSYSYPYSSSAPWYSNRSSVKKVVINDGVTSIGDYAFDDCSNLTSVTIGDGVTSIGDYAFDDCTSLTSIIIPDSVTGIGQSAFYDCTSLTSIIIPDSVTSIGKSAFYNCDSLASVTIPNGMTSIGKYAFWHCKGLTSITIPDSVTSIGDYAFYHCDSLTSITIPDSVTSIGADAFGWCGNLTSITIPDSVTSIGNSAFRNCTSLMSITIPSSVVSIGGGAFDCAAKEVHISDLAAWCGIEFGYYFSEGIFEDDDFDDYYGYGNPLYYAENLYLNGKLVTNLVIPDTVIQIKSDAFEGCKSITSVVIPSSVKSVGAGAFSGCTNLSTVYYCGTEENWNKIQIAGGNSYITDAAISFHKWVGGNCASRGTCELCGAISEGNLHTWIDATCTTPQYCFICETIGASALGHSWEGDCTTPNTCTVCGAVEGTAPGHKWVDATCTTPKTCSVCGVTQGNVAEHSWRPATCTTPKTCSVCGKTEGAIQHTWVAANCTAPKTCSSCGKTEGTIQHTWVAATCTVPKHCSACGLTDGIASHTYSGASDGICNVCGEKRMLNDSNLTFYGNAGMSLKDYIGMQILMKNSVATGYDKVYAIAVQKTPTGDITTTITGSPYAGVYTYFEQKILARSMCDNVTLTLYGEKNGVTYQGASITTSILQLSMEKLAIYKAQNDTAKCKIIVDMLNFGAAVQTTFKVNTHQMPNANLGEYAVYGSTYEPTLEATNSITGTATVKVGQHNISMQDRVEIQLLFTTDVSAYRAVAMMGGVDVEVSVDTETFKAYGYTVVRVPIAPANFRETYTIALYDTDGNPVTQIYNVSVEGYANARKDTDKHTLDVAFMRYSDSVAAVFRKN